MNFDILKGLAWSRSLIFIRVSEGRRDRQNGFLQQCALTRRDSVGEGLNEPPEGQGFFLNFLTSVNVE